MTWTKGDRRRMSFMLPILQVLGAEVVLEPGRVDLEALKVHCARNLTPYNVPLQFTVVEAIARTASGKILRRPTREADEAPVAADEG